MLKNQLYPLNRMHQHPRQTHPPLPRHLRLLAPIIIHPLTQPPFPQIRRKPRIIIPRRAAEIMLALVRENARAGPASSAVEAVVEDGRQICGRPRAVDVDGVRGVDGFVAVVEGDGAGPHFREHGMPLHACFAVHCLQ